jgi:FAD-dependent oxidoreductase domain-containing protein 1
VLHERRFPRGDGRIPDEAHAGLERELNTNGRVVIVGGAIVGSMTAYFLREQGHAGPIIVLERDPTYQFSSTARSVSAIRTQFDTPISVRMSLFGAAFIKSLKQRFGAEADIGFRERGYLILGGEDTVEGRLALAQMQIDNGASIAVLGPNQLGDRFPWLKLDGVGLGTLGTTNEGWFDAWALLQLARTEARRLGVDYRHAEAVGFETNGSRVTSVRTASGETIAAGWVVNAAGPASGRVASWLGIDLPVSPRKRTAFHIKAPLDGSTMPLLFDGLGTWMRPEGNGFICGTAPQGDDADATGDFEPDYGLFEDFAWPAIARCVPALENLRLESAWAGHYEINALDHNGVVGRHDVLENFVFACGFSGHGVMHSPATGRGVAELIVHGGYRTLDLTPLGYERVRDGRPIIETIVY